MVFKTREIWKNNVSVVIFREKIWEINEVFPFLNSELKDTFFSQSVSKIFKNYTNIYVDWSHCGLCALRAIFC